MSDTDLLVLLSVVLAAIVVGVVAVALIEVRRGLRRDLGRARDARLRLDGTSSRSTCDLSSPR